MSAKRRRIVSAAATVASIAAISPDTEIGTSESVPPISRTSPTRKYGESGSTRWAFQIPSCAPVSSSSSVRPRRPRSSVMVIVGGSSCRSAVAPPPAGPSRADRWRAALAETVHRSENDCAAYRPDLAVRVRCAAPQCPAPETWVSTTRIDVWCPVPTRRIDDHTRTIGEPCLPLVGLGARTPAPRPRAGRLRAAPPRVRRAGRRPVRRSRESALHLHRGPIRALVVSPSGGTRRARATGARQQA